MGEVVRMMKLLEKKITVETTDKMANWNDDDLERMLEDLERWIDERLEVIVTRTEKQFEVKVTLDA